MAIIKTELMDWLAIVKDDESIGIDDSGLTLRVVERQDSHWIEMGGIPEEPHSLGERR